MMDGRVGAIRSQLDAEGYTETPIIAYSAKFASAFYGPFREAAESAPAFGDRRGYQMDPANVREAVREAAIDVEEGADVVMVKPALPYLDVIARVREAVPVPVAAYNVSGEYAAIKAAAERGWLDERAAVLETLTSIRRAGADIDRHLPRQGGGRVAAGVRSAVSEAASARRRAPPCRCDETDKRLLNLLQSSFPLDPRPFAAVAARPAAERGRGDGAAPSSCSTSASSGRSRRSSTRRRSATARCWSPRRWTRATLTARAADHQRASRRLAQLPAQPRVQPLVHDRGRRPTRSSASTARSRCWRDLQRRRVDAPAADDHDVQDQHEPGDGGRDRGARRARRRRSSRCRATRSRSTTSTSTLIRATAGPDGGALRRLRAGGRAARCSGGAAAGALEGWSSGSCCAASRRSCSTAAPASPPTAWASGRCRRRDRRDSARGWPRCAASRTATGGRPIPTGPTASSRWRTGARRRSATRCSTASPTSCGLAGDGPRDALLLDRVQEDPPALLHAGLRRHGRRGIAGSAAVRARSARPSRELFERAPG